MTKIFENIITKTTSANVSIDDRNERLIILDEKTGEFYYEVDSLMKAKGFLGKKYSYYIVNFNEFTKINELNCEISDPIDGITIKLKISFELSCIKGKAIRAIRFLNKTNDPYKTLERYFSNWTRDFVSEHENFTDDFIKLDKELRDHIKDKAEREGLRVKISKLEPFYNEDTNFPPEHMTIIHSSKAEILEDYIEVENKIVLNLINKRLFSWQNIKDPELWIKEKTNVIIQNELINKSFDTIISGFESEAIIKKNITRKLHDAVKAIGYSIQHIVSVPSKEIKDFFEGFNINENSIFSTSEPEIQIRLGISIDVKESEEKTTKGIDKKFIKPRKSIIKEAKKQALMVIGSSVRGVHPEKCYTDFDNVSSYIKDELHSHLSKSFGLKRDNYTIHLNLLKTDLIKRFDKLYSERGTIQIDTKSEDIYYQIKYRAEHVNDWYVFHKNHIKFHEKTTEEYDLISEFIKNEIELDSKYFGKNQISLVDNKDLDSVINRLFVNTQKMITEEFGLKLGKPRLTRIANNSIINKNEIYAEGYIERVKQLKNKFIEALRSEEDDDEVERITKELEDLESKILKITESKDSFLKLRDDELNKKDKQDEEE